jgi:hypothetical protein
LGIIAIKAPLRPERSLMKWRTPSNQQQIISFWAAGTRRMQSKIEKCIPILRRYTLALVHDRQAAAGCGSRVGIPAALLSRFVVRTRRKEHPFGLSARVYTRCSSALCQDTWRFNQKGLFGIMGSNLGRTSPPNSRRDFTMHLSLACISPRDFFPDNPRAPIGSVGHDEQKAFLALVQGDRNQ